MSDYATYRVNYLHDFRGWDGQANAHYPYQQFGIEIDGEVEACRALSEQMQMYLKVMEQVDARLMWTWDFSELHDGQPQQVIYVIGKPNVKLNEVIDMLLQWFPGGAKTYQEKSR